MNDETRKEYQTACRSAAMSILLSQTDLETEARALAERFSIAATLVSRDLDLILQGERQKVRGVFRFDDSHPKRSGNDD